MPRLLLPACCLLLLTLTAARAEDAKPLAVFPMGPDRMPFVTLSFGGKDYECLVYTGTSTTVLHEAARPALGNLTGENGGKSYYTLPEVSLGSLRLPPGTFAYCRDLSLWTARYGRPVEGLVGRDLMAKMAVALDYDEGVVKLHLPTYRPNEPEGRAATFSQPQLSTVAKVCGEELLLAIETGFNGELSLCTSQLDRYFALGAASNFDGWGGGGANDAQIQRFGRVSAAGLTGFQHEIVMFSEQRDKRTDTAGGLQLLNLLGRLSLGEPQGAVGIHFLARYNPTFRLADSEVVFAKSNWRDGRWWPDLRGMTLVELGRQLIVFSVQRDSPAARAGMEPNDEVDLPRDFVTCSELWGNTLPLTLSVRKANASDFVLVRLEANGDPGNRGDGHGTNDVRVVASASADVRKPLASFPMGTDRRLWGTLSFGGKDYHCLFDTGAVMTFFNKRLASDLGVALKKADSVSFHALPEASIGGLQVPAGTIAVCGDLDDVSQGLGQKIDAIVGLDFLGRASLSLDFDRGVVTLYEPNFRPEGPTETAKMYCLPRPYTMAKVSGQEFLMLIDSGSDHELGLRKALLQGFCERGDAILLARKTSVTARGLVNRRWGLLASAGLTGSQHGQVQVFEGDGDRFDGVIGIPFLARYNSTLRFAQNELVLSKSKWHDAEWWPDLRGMRLAEVGGRRIVFAVTPDSSAYRAGIRPDDEVDVPADFYYSMSSSFSKARPLPDPSSRKYLVGWAPDLPVQIAARERLWHTDGPLTLRIRKPHETDFAPVRIGEDSGIPARSLEDLIARWLAERHVSGASIAVVKSGSVLVSKGFGLADIEKGDPATEDTPYSMVSLSQSFTAAAIMLLVREGRLSLDDRITDRLPGLPDGWREVTVRHLLNHSSGIKSFESPQDDGQSAVPSALAMLRQVADEPLEFAPGEKNVYCYTNYLLLGLLIEEMAGQTYDQFVTARILLPLGMTSTRPYAGRPGGDCARRYKWNDKERKHEPHVEWLYPAGLGAFVSTLADLLKWEAAIQERSLLDEATLEQMWTLPNRRLMGYGYGWDMGSENGHRLILSGGSSSQIARYVDDQLTVIVLMNAVDGRADELTRDIASRVAPELGVQTEPILEQDPATNERLRGIVSNVQQGRIDPSLFAAKVSELVATDFKDLQEKIAAAGELDRFQLVYAARVVQGTGLTFRATFERRTLMISFWLDAAGQIFSVNVRPLGR